MTGLWLVSYIALWLLFLIVAVVLLSVLRNLGVIYEAMAALPTAAANQTKLASGELLPELTLETLDGKVTHLSAFRGKKTAFTVISPQCSPCQSLLQDIAISDAILDPLNSPVRRRVVISVGNAVDAARLTEQVRLPAALPILVDAGNSIRDKWGLISTPTTVVVDEQLRVVRHMFGAVSTIAERRIVDTLRT